MNDLLVVLVFPRIEGRTVEIVVRNDQMRRRAMKERNEEDSHRQDPSRIITTSIVRARACSQA
jgi:hypothetical protein